MTKRNYLLITTLMVIFCLSGVVWAQPPTGNALTQLREEIRKLEVIGSDASTPETARVANNQLLTSRRTQFSKLSQQEIEGLRSYLKKADLVLSSDEKKRITDLISELEKERQATIAALNAHDPGTGVIKSSANNRLDDKRWIEPLRTVVGFEQVGLASANLAQRAFLDFFLTSPPLFPSEEKKCGMRCLRLWGNVRFSSLPKNNLSVGGTDTKGNVAAFPIKTFSVAGSNDFFNSVANGDLKDVTHSVEFLIGPEFRILDRQHISIGLIAAGGAITPTSPNDSLSFFEVPEKAKELYPQATWLHQYKAGDTVAFTAPDRDRLLKHYYGGLRFRTDFKEDGKPDAIFDVTVGQSEAVTGGRLRGSIMRLDGFYPLPMGNGQFLYLFGTAMLKLGRANVSDPVILKPVQPVELPAPNVHLITTQANRDIYRFGIGVDLLKLLNPGTKPQEKN